MKERPILFSGELVRAILDGRKTQTRRVVKPRQLHCLPHETVDQSIDDMRYSQEGLMRCCPYGVPGDRLWVKEKYAFGGNGVFYGDRTDGTVRIAWNNPLFMPKKYARIWLEIVSVRVERLQEISPKDAMFEGIKTQVHLKKIGKFRYGIGDVWSSKNAPDAFRQLWDSLNAKRGFGWDKNPWVWVIEFAKAKRK